MTRSDFATLWREILILKRRIEGVTALTGDVTAGPGNGSQPATITNNAVTNTKLADMAQDRIKGRADAAGTGDPTDLTPDQASDVLDTASDPFLRTSAATSGITQLTGDVTAGPGSGSQLATIAADAVTNSKAANMAQATLKGRATGAGTGDPTDLSANQTSDILDTATDPFLRTSAASGSALSPIVYELDGAGADLSGTFTRYFRIPDNGTITKATLLGDVSGDWVVDLWLDTFGSYPPTDSDSITGGNELTLSGADSVEESTFSGWSTTSLTAGDILGFNTDSISGIQWAILILEITP